MDGSNLWSNQKFQSPQMDGLVLSCECTNIRLRNNSGPS